jgi:hypothetical protein
MVNIEPSILLQNLYTCSKRCTVYANKCSATLGSLEIHLFLPFYVSPNIGSYLDPASM